MRSLMRKLSKAPCVALVLALSCTLGSDALAQRFQDMGKRHMPRTSSAATSVTAVDVDGDGDLDLAVACDDATGARNLLYVNDGNGAFQDETVLRMPNRVESSSAVAAGDFDRDGDADLVFANYDGSGARNRYYVNDGNGYFVDRTVERMPNLRNYSTSVAMGDVDGDGDLDLVFGNTTDPPFYSLDGRNRLYLNDGAGRFADGTSGRLADVAPSTGDVALVDVDDDGDLDLVAVN